MGQFLIVLSLVPILSVVLNNKINGEKRLSYLPAIVIYLTILWALLFSNDINHFLIPFLTIENNQIDLLFNFKYDHTLMSKVVLLISSLVLIYSSKFLESENLRSSNKYFLFITIFISSMFLFTLSNDLFSSFIFWEILGLSSYFLIGFWNKDSEAIESSTIAFWITRFGDIFFLAGIILIFTSTGTLDIDKLNDIKPFEIEIPVALIVIGVFSKSAQFPFNIWLPKAMKGPTPVSALIHSATMVVAGVLLLYKIYPLISNSDLILNTLIVVGLISSVAGSIVAFFEKDLKKILAYSTISHIGLMFLAIGIKEPTLAYFHMFSHSFFKSLLFLYAGVVITANGTSKLEELRNSIKLRSTMGVILVIGCCSLGSIYLFTGSFSKEYIIFSLINNEAYISGFALLIGMIFTSLYAAKILFTLIDFKGSIKKESYVDTEYLAPLLILALLSIIGPITMGIFKGSIPFNEVPHSFLTIIFFQLLTLVLFYKYYKDRANLEINLHEFKNISYSLFKTDPIYIEIYEKVFKSTSHFIGWFDRNIIDGLVNYLPFKIIQISKELMLLQGGLAKTYAIRTIVFFILLILTMSVINNFAIIEVLK